MSLLLCRAAPISSHFILTAVLQVHVVVLILQVRNAQLREVIVVGKGTLVFSLRNVWLQKARDHACKNLVGNSFTETIAMSARQTPFPCFNLMLPPGASFAGQIQPIATLFLNWLRRSLLRAGAYSWGGA